MKKFVDGRNLNAPEQRINVARDLDLGSGSMELTGLGDSASIVVGAACVDAK